MWSWEFVIIFSHSPVDHKHVFVSFLIFLTRNLFCDNFSCSCVIIGALLIGKEDMINTNKVCQMEKAWGGSTNFMWDLALFFQSWLKSLQMAFCESSFYPSIHNSPAIRRFYNTFSEGYFQKGTLLMAVFICRHKAKLERQSPLKNKQKDTENKNWIQFNEVLPTNFPILLTAQDGQSIVCVKRGS